MRLPNYFQIIGPYQDFKDTKQPIGKTVLRGWEIAKKLLSSRTYSWMNRPPNEVAMCWEGYPSTLLHGDYRPANLGYSFPTGKMTLIDWAFAGYGAGTVDLFWYLATTSHLRTNNEKSANQYRRFLEQELSERICDDEWEKLKEIGTVSACYMQLWEKALAYPQDKEDWEWWVGKLDKIVEKFS